MEVRFKIPEKNIEIEPEERTSPDGRWDRIGRALYHMGCDIFVDVLDDDTYELVFEVEPAQEGNLRSLIESVRAGVFAGDAQAYFQELVPV